MKRRDFSTLLATGAVLANVQGLAASPPKRRGQFVPADRKVRIAVIGCGHQGNMDLKGMLSEEIVAICDPCQLALDSTAEKAPGAKQYRDYRAMLEEMDDGIDAVIVATPEHMHYTPALMAIRMGKHVYVEKPLTHTVWEARELQKAATEHQVVAQMGNHGHAFEGCRQVKEYVDAGLIGEIREAHIWTNKPEPGSNGNPNPWWPYEIEETPSDTPAVPDTLDWNLWLGVAPRRPYNPVYHPKRWRRFHDFGTGSLGDMGCHVIDAAFYALNLDYPTSLFAESPEQAPGLYPNTEHVVWTFGARGNMPPVTLNWYGGAWEVPPIKFMDEGQTPGKKGGALIGEKGTIMWTDDYCKSARLLPRALWIEINEKGLKPEPSIPRVPKGDARMEFVNACKGGPRPGSNFDHAAPLTEMVLLGNIAIRNNKQRLDWNGKQMEITNHPQANALVTKNYRTF
jgi:predicted dehydrogenase